MNKTERSRYIESFLNLFIAAAGAFFMVNLVFHGSHTAGVISATVFSVLVVYWSITLLREYRRLPPDSVDAARRFNEHFTAYSRFTLVVAVAAMILFKFFHSTH